MSRQKTHHTKQFKLDAINYRKEHPDLTQVECAKNLGIGVSTLARWEAQFRDNDGDIPVIGSGSYASDEAKEIARLKRELRDTQVDMLTTVFVGNSRTRVMDGRMVTPRGYRGV